MMKSSYKVKGAFAILAAIVSGCGGDADSGWRPTMENPPPAKFEYLGKDTSVFDMKDDDVVAAVNGAVLTKGDLVLRSKQIAWVLGRTQGLKEQLRNQMQTELSRSRIQSFVDNEVLKQKSREEGLVAEADIRKAAEEAMASFAKMHRIDREKIDAEFPGGGDAIRREAEDACWARAYLDKHEVKGIVVTDEAVSNILADVAAENAVIAASNRTIRARLEDIRRKIVAGEVTFEEMAEKFNEDASHGEDGYWGVFRRSDLPENEELFSLEVGEVSEIMNDGVSYFIVKMLKHDYAERNADGKLTKPETIELAHIELIQEELTVPAEGPEGIKADLQRQMDEQAVRECIDALKGTMSVVYPNGTNFWDRGEKNQ